MNTVTFIPGMIPPTFSGRDNEDVTSFCNRMDRFLTAHKLGNTEGVQVIAFQLGGIAERWYDAKYQRGAPPTTTGLLLEALTERFTSEQTKVKLSRELDMLKQGSDMHDYTAKFSNYIARLGLNKTKDKDQKQDIIRRFRRGLNKEARIQLAMHDPDTLEKNIELALAFDQALKGATWERPRRPYVPAAQDDDDAMDVDAMAQGTPEQQRDFCRKNGLTVGIPEALPTVPPQKPKYGAQALKIDADLSVSKMAIRPPPDAVVSNCKSDVALSNTSDAATQQLPHEATMLKPIDTINSADMKHLSHAQKSKKTLKMF
ncbi:hypothetical protein GGI07_004264 [Coemansia sp. Benny D115]|nr:hypothetical protein GGI07_004264 [Coemansia sp. Benny D115]